MNSLRKSLKFILLIAIIGLPLSKTLVHLMTEVWWFDAVGFAEVFWTKLTWQILAWVVTFVVYTLFLWGNYRLAMHWTWHRSFRFLEDSDLAVANCKHREMKLQTRQFSNHIVGLTQF